MIHIPLEELGLNSPLKNLGEQKSYDITDLYENEDIGIVLNYLGRVVKCETKEDFSSFTHEDIDTLMRIDAVLDIPRISIVTEQPYQAVRRLAKNNYPGNRTPLWLCENACKREENSSKQDSFGLINKPMLDIWQEVLFYNAIDNDDLEIMQWIWNNINLSFKYTGKNNDSVYTPENWTAILINSNAVSRAAQFGRIRIIEWLVHHLGCEWKRWICVSAAAAGQLETLKWLRDPKCHPNGKVCPFDCYSGIFAAKNDQFEVIKWIYDTDRESNTEIEHELNWTWETAVDNKHYDIAQFIMKKNGDSLGPVTPVRTFPSGVSIRCVVPKSLEDQVEPSGMGNMIRSIQGKVPVEVNIIENQ